MTLKKMERICPNCKAPLPVGSGVKFDAEHNVICAKCDQPIVAATLPQENLIKAPKPVGSTTTTSPNGVKHIGHAPGHNLPAAYM